YRTIGLGAKLVRETLPLIGTPYVEMPAVMAKYNPFAEKAGMRKITMQQPDKRVLRIAETLRQLGFNPQLLGSEKYALAKLQNLTEKEIKTIKQSFIDNSLPRFIKNFDGHRPFGNKEEFARELEKVSLERLAHLIRICSFLLQTKAYLFWTGPQE
ncbi:MAG: hypothetical protein QXH91_08690, partial [Candidatus Bathyarchaeia archaeon]